MELTREDIKDIRIDEDGISIENGEGAFAKEYFEDYPSLKMASTAQRKNYSVSKYGIHWPELDEDLSFDGFFKPKPKLLSNIFAPLSEINVSAFARTLGIPQPLMAAYLNGAKTPSMKRRKEIERELHRIGRKLLGVRV